MMFYNYSHDWQEVKSTILVNKIAEAFFGVKSKKSKDIGDKPDLKKFNRLYGNKIITPDKKKQ